MEENAAKVPFEVNHFPSGHTTHSFPQTDRKTDSPGTWNLLPCKRGLKASGGQVTVTPGELLSPVFRVAVLEYLEAVICLLAHGPLQANQVRHPQPSKSSCPSARVKMAPADHLGENSGKGPVCRMGMALRGSAGLLRKRAGWLW